MAARETIGRGIHMATRTFAYVISLVLLSGPNFATAQEWFIDTNSPSNPGTGTQSDPFRTIQDGIDAATPTQTVFVASGTYSGPGNLNLDFQGKDIELACQGTCTIDAQDTAIAFHFHSGETNLAVVRGFRIVAGSGSSSGGGVVIENSSPTITRCVFDRCDALDGGAVYVAIGSPKFSFCSFFRNHAEGGGGAIFASSATLTLNTCVFDQNTSVLGGGAMNLQQTEVTATGCLLSRSDAGSNGGAVLAANSTGFFDQCIFVSNTSGDHGGAFRLESAINLTIKDSQFLSNDAIDGGALQCLEGDPTLTNNLFAFNQVTGRGGAMHLSDCNPKITNNTLAYNNGAVGGGAIYGRSSVATIINTISRRNLPDEFDLGELDPPVVSDSNIEGGWFGDRITDQDPLFGPGPSGQFYLWQEDAGQLIDSPMIDAGQATSETADLTMFTTRRDNVTDANTVDIGFHYAPFPFGTTPNDTDRDDDVDLIELQKFQNCYTGPTAEAYAPLPPPCGKFDFDSNLTIELDDYQEFAFDMTGP